MAKAQAVVGQSGGPTSVINSSLVGVVEAARRSPRIGRVYGMRFGIEGFMEDRLLELSGLPRGLLQGLRRTPSSALGSSRHKVGDEDLPRILEILKKHDIRYLFLIGGNDTMDTIHRVEGYCRRQGYELTGVGIPKTVDNDLFGTDHTPGFPSAARCNILNVLQAGLLARDMRRVDSFVIYQSIGRDAGWLAAAAAVAKRDEADAPHLIYLPERPFDRERFLADAAECQRRYGWVSIVCGEGLKQADGSPVSASQVRDKFGNVEFGAMGGASVAMSLHGLLKERLGLRGEFQITESLIMCAMDRAVELDLEEAYGCGREAVRLAEAGRSGVMVALERQPGRQYRTRYATAALEEVAVKSKPMPPEYINAEGNFVTEAFLQYIRPLVGPIPEYTSL
jgi:6-phosphofructokinase